jgi:flagellar protein FlgJ
MGLRQACEEFEALFFQEILKGLRRTIPEGHSRARSMYQDLLDEQMARLCARRGVGLGELLLSRLEGVQGPEPSAGGATKGFSDAADKEE